MTEDTPRTDEPRTGVNDASDSSDGSAPGEAGPGTGPGAVKTETIRDLERKNKELLVRVRELEFERVGGGEQKMVQEEKRCSEAAGVEDDPYDRADAEQWFAVTAPLKFTMHAVFYYAGKAADKIVSLYGKAFKLDRGYVADFNKAAGIGHAKHGRWAKAIPLLEKAFAMTPGDLDVGMHLAKAYSGAKQYEKACGHLEGILETSPGSARAVRALGFIYSRRRDHERAIEYLARAVELDPDDAQAYYRLGAAYDSKKQYGQAVESFKKAIAVDPRLARAHQAMGFTYESMGDRESAVECFKRALELE